MIALDTNVDNLPLFEQYRPTDFDQVLGQDKAVKRLRVVAKRGIGGKAYWFNGESGTGKTTLAYILASQIADSFCCEELDAADLTPAKVKELEKTSQVSGMFGGLNGRAFIVNESHGLRKDTIRQLLVTLERIPKHVAWIFTTTNDGQQMMIDGIDTGPLMSRTISIKLAQRGLAKAFAERAREIAISEELADSSITVKPFLEAVRQSRNNFRAVLMQVESGAFL